MSEPTKTIIQVTVLTNEPFVDAIGDSFTLDQVHYLINEGHAVGDYHVVSTQEITKDEMRKELLNAGNDGEFFDEEWAEEAEDLEGADDDGDL